MPWCAWCAALWACAAAKPGCSVAEPIVWWPSTAAHGDAAKPPPGCSIYSSMFRLSALINTLSAIANADRRLSPPDQPKAGWKKPMITIKFQISLKMQNVTMSLLWAKKNPSLNHLSSRISRQTFSRGIHAPIRSRAEQAIFFLIWYAPRSILLLLHRFHLSRILMTYWLIVVAIKPCGLSSHAKNDNGNDDDDDGNGHTIQMNDVELPTCTPPHPMYQRPLI